MRHLNLFLSITLLTAIFAISSPLPHIMFLVPFNTARGLHEPGNPMYCSKSTQFTIGYKICTFAAQINPLMIAHLWLFDSGCSVIGEIPNVDVFLLRQNDVQIKNSHVDFDSRLKYVVVTDLKDGKSPVTIMYAGRSFGGNKNQCWRDTDSWYVCSFEFQC